MNPAVRSLLAGSAGVALTLVVNALGILWLNGTLFESPALYDGSAALLTLALPAFGGGLLVGGIAREQGMNIAAVAFVLFGFAGLLHPFWRVPLVSSNSAHSGVMHYFLANPLVAVAFGTLGGWLGGQFATGKFVLADREPVPIPGLED